MTCETCPDCGGTGIDKETVWTPDLVDFEWCPRCDGTGTVEEPVEHDPYENADEWYDTRCDRW